MASPPTTLSVRIAATFTAEPLMPVLDAWLRSSGMNAELRFAPSKQVHRQLLDAGSVMSGNPDGVNVILVRSADLGVTTESRARGAAREVAAALSESVSRDGTRTMLMICPVAGSGRADATFAADLADQLDGVSGVELLDAGEVERLYPVDEVFDAAADESARVPYCEDMFVALATYLARRITALLRKPYKVIAVDCDGTLWTGCCAEAGPCGVVVDGPRQLLQRFLMERRAEGTLLCMVSKNAAENVEAVFRENPAMIIPRSAFVDAVINWQPKSANLVELAGRLNIGLDGFLFLDDDPAEVAEVRAGAPAALAVRMPEDPGVLPSFLDHLWVLDRVGRSAEDSKRADFYHDEARRRELREQAANFTDYIENLQLEVEIRPMVAADVPWASQLTRHTNQFNSWPCPRDEEAMLEACRGMRPESVVVRDRFGDHGLVGLMLTCEDGGRLWAETFLLNCGALGKGVEHRMVRHLGRMALKLGLDKVAIWYRDTGRNQPCRDFLESVRDGCWEDNLWVIPAVKAASCLLLPVVAQAREGRSVATVPRADPGFVSQVAHELRTVDAIREWADSSVPERPLVEAPAEIPAVDSTQTTTSEVSACPPPAARRDELAGRLRRLVEELSGVTVADDSATFTELGFDSLFLTQLSQAILARHGVKVTFRQMFGELASVAALADHLDAQIPELEAQPSASSPAVAVSASGPDLTVPGADPTEQWIVDNIRLMRELLEKRRAAPPASPAGPRITRVRWPAGLPSPESAGVAAAKRFGPYQAPEKAAGGGMTSRQRRWLDKLISRYVSKTAGSKALTADHRPHLADPRAVSGFNPLWKEMVYPIVSARSKGSKIWDVDGNEYVDITMGFGTCLFGHSPDWLTEALEEQLHSGIEIGPQSPLAGRLAKSICELTAMDRVTFCNTGSEAVMAAMRLARTVTGRERIAYFTGDYHGMFEEVLVRGAWVDGVYRAQPIAAGIPQSLVDNMLVLDYADPASLEILKSHAHELAAVMVEPVQSRNPALQPRGFMRELREITRRSGSALVFDEVVTGFRCHPGGAQAYFGVEADLATYGKVVGGGLPIGVLAGRRQFMDALDGGAWSYGDDSFPEVGVTLFAGTFVRHPLALAAASRVIEHLRGEGPRLQIDMEERVGRFCRTLNDHCEAAGVPVRLPHFSSHAVLEHASDLPFASLLWYHLREKGVHAWEGRPFHFTTAHSDEDLDYMIGAFVESIDEMQVAGFLPESSAGSLARPRAFPRCESAPTTEAQREIFHGVMMGPEANCSFNESKVIRFDGVPDLTAMKAAVGDVIARHPALRSTFSADGTTQYYHAAPRQAEITEDDLSSAGSDLAEAEFERIKSRESGTPFDLMNGPLHRVHLIGLAADRHRLIFTAHHIVCDGWSFGMVLRELAAAYNARRAGCLPMLPPAMSFAEFARMEEAGRGGPEVVESEKFWVSQFSAGAPVLELPTDRPRPKVKTYPGAVEAITLDSDRYRRLRELSPRLGGTMFPTLLACFATLLHRLTGQDDLVIGVPAAGQRRVGRDELVGHCLNFLPLRLRPQGENSFGSFVGEVKDRVLDAYEHQHYTWGSLLRKLALPRDTSRPPLVSVMFNVDKVGIDQAHFGDLEFDVATNPKQFVNFELFFNLVQTDRRMVVECEYNTDLHDASTIRRWLDCFEQLIESVITCGEAKLDELPMLGDAERRQVLDDWNATSRDYPRDATVHELVAELAGRVPARPAVRCGPDSLSYAELDRQATEIAARLQAAGVARGDLVGIHLQRSTVMPAGLLAILKCGAAYVPMDPAFPAERLAMMVDDARMRVILSQSSLCGTLPASGARVLLVDEPEQVTPGFIPVESAATDLAYVIFTSGSTGRPKGVRVSHRAVVNFLNSMRREPGLTADDVLLSVTTLSFDIAGLEIFLPLTSGAVTVIAGHDTTIDGRLLAAAIERHEVTVLQATPGTWRLLLEAGWSGREGLKILIGGEAVPRDLVNRLGPLCGEIWNVYGPTETTIWSTTCRLAAGDGPVSIGRPIDNTRVYVVNSAGQVQPPGIAGELLIGGDGLAEGYHERDELTGERFINSPFQPGEKLYRTGDLARWNPDGTLECLGRMDQQVKLRGFRIELGEVESVLEQHHAVTQAAVHVHDGRLVACVKPEGVADAADLWRDRWDMLHKSAIDQAGSAGPEQLDGVVAGWMGGDKVGQQVDEWISTALERIGSHGGQRIFEIGCGRGQLLSRLAPESDCYWASDISEVAISALRSDGPPARAKLMRRPADDFSDIPDGYFDTVIINSVAQYFPDEDYLRRVIEGAVRATSSGGRVFIGDVQGCALLATQHADAMRERVAAGTTAGQFRGMVADRLARESGLSVDPAWFDVQAAGHSGIAAVETQLRRGRAVNETTVYHYDAILHVGEAPARRALSEPTKWRVLNLEQLEAALADDPGTVWLTHIPDARLVAPVSFHRTLLQAGSEGEIPAVDAAQANAVSPEDLFESAAQAGYRAHVRWMSDGSDGLMEAAFLRGDDPGLPDWPPLRAAGPGHPLVNVPQLESAGNAELVSILRKHLATRLPDYMIPASLLVVSEFPLTPNGKVDRKALPAPCAGEPELGPRAAREPRTRSEMKLLEIWKQVLRRPDIGIDDDIFELGGDSILIFQIATRASRAGITLSPAQLFRHRTISALAARSAERAPAAAGSTIQRVDRNAYRRNE